MNFDLGFKFFSIYRIYKNVAITNYYLNFMGLHSQIVIIKISYSNVLQIQKLSYNV